MKTNNKLKGYKTPTMKYLSLIMTSNILLKASDTDLEQIENEGEL